MAQAPNGGCQIGVNLGFTRFLFFSLPGDDDAIVARLRAAAGMIARGFFNDFEGDSNGSLSHETIQFLVNERWQDQSGVPGSRYALQISSKYRPRLQDTEKELRRRLNGEIGVVSIEGAVRAPQYTSPAMHEYAFRHALGRVPGRTQCNVIILPIRKTKEWWDKDPIDRHAYFYPRPNPATGMPIKGHARVAEPGIRTIHRRLYYNPDGHGRPGEFDFITYFECEDQHLATFNEIRRALRDEHQNPEWKFVVEGPEWRGRRVMRW